LACALGIVTLNVGASGEEIQCPRTGSAYSANGSSIVLPEAASGRPFDILAIGSSSTAGVGASSPSRAYPARLATEFANRDGLDVKVRNAGIGGEVASATLARLKAALATGWAQLVIWQVGTNDALVGVDEGRFRVTLEEGIAAAKAAGVSLMLLDPQFLPNSSAEPRYRRYVGIVDDVGARDHVPVFSRYAMMRALADRSAGGIAPLISGDGLHMSDLGYACLAHALAQTIEGGGAPEQQAASARAKL
jgi:acyl-CoA thioesterase-1